MNRTFGACVVCMCATSLWGIGLAQTHHVTCGTAVPSVGLIYGDPAAHVSIDTGPGIPFVFHIVRDDSGRGGFVAPSEDVGYDLRRALDFTHELFAQSGWPHQFNLVETLDGATLSSHRRSEYLDLVDNERHEMQGELNRHGKVNVYLVESLSIDGSTVLGVGSYPGSPVQGIILTWHHLFSSGAVTPLLAHEIGHFFFLFHTYEREHFGPEDVTRDPRNCEPRGDRLCDTPADPRNGIRWQEDGCVFVSEARDSRNTPYSPDTNNIMSAAPWACQTRFTPGQINRMLGALERGAVTSGPTSLPPSIPVAAFPNPYSPAAGYVTILVSPPSGFTHAFISIVSVDGRRFRDIYSGLMDGAHDTTMFRWDGRDKHGRQVASGVYFIRVEVVHSQAGTSIGYEKIVLLR